jgi:hypothetical protein
MLCFVVLDFLKWAVADCCLLFYYWMVAGSKVITVRTQLVLYSNPLLPTDVASVPNTNHIDSNALPRLHSASSPTILGFLLSLLLSLPATQAAIHFDRLYLAAQGHRSRPQRPSRSLVITGNTSRLFVLVRSYHTASYCWCFLLVRSIHSTTVASSFNRLRSPPSLSIVVVCALLDPQQSVFKLRIFHAASQPARVLWSFL